MRSSIALSILSVLTLVSAQCQTLMPAAAQQLSSAEPDRVFPNVASGPAGPTTIEVADDSSLFSSNQLPGLATFHVPAGAQNCFIAMADPLNSRSYQTLLGLPPNINFVSFKKNTMEGLPTTYNTVYGSDNIIDVHFASLNALVWDGRIARKPTPCPPAINGQYGVSYHGMELNILGPLGIVIPGNKRWSLTQASDGQLGQSGPNGVFMQYNC